jgi:Ca2+-binding EF-hand superfamily protein
VRSFIEIEISFEKLRQKIINKLAVKTETAFKTMDTDQKGYLVMDDLRNFLTSQNMYPIEKNLQLLYERLDKEEKKAVNYDDFLAGMKPFLTGLAATE